jgi:inorganic pyrophosphatase
MSIESYLGGQPFTEIAAYKPDSHAAGIAFTGVLRKHPYDEDKCLLIADPSGCEPAILEFRVADVLGADERPSPVDEGGHSLQLVRLWIKKGSFGIRYEPFEVDEPVKKGSESQPIRERIMKTVRCQDS